MAFDRQPIFVFENENSTGLNTVPLNALIASKCSGKMYQYTDKTGITNTTTLNSVKGVNIKEYTLLAILYNNAMFMSSLASTRTITLFSSNATLKNAEVSLGNDGGSGYKGGNVGANALFNNTSTSGIVIVNSSSIVVQAEKIVGTVRSLPESTKTSNGNILFYGGQVVSNSAFCNICTLVSPLASLVQTENNIGSARSYLSGASLGINSLYYRGFNGSAGVATTTLISSTATLVQAETNLGTYLDEPAGVGFGSTALFYGGFDFSSGYSNRVTIVNTSIAIAQTETSIGTRRGYYAGAITLTNALFYAGQSGGTTSPSWFNTNTVTLMTSTGTLVQAETNIGTIRASNGGSSI